MRPIRDNFWLYFDDPISKQLEGKVSPGDGQLLDQLNAARKLLVEHKCLPEPPKGSYWGAPIEKQIVRRAQVFMRKWEMAHKAHARAEKHRVAK